MAEPIASYMKTLERDLRGRLSAAEVTSILDESASHLYELAAEMGSEEKAVAKFGNPHRSARKILYGAAGIPNAWRASILPFSLFFGYFAFNILAPWQVIERLVGPMGGFDSGLGLIQNVVIVLTIVSFSRARQILFKPLAVLSLVSVVALVGMFYSLGNRVTVPGEEGLIVARRPGGVEQATSALGQEIADWRKSENQLRLGMSFYDSATGAKTVPQDLMFHGSRLNPATIVVRLAMDDSPTTWQDYLVPFFGSESVAFGGVDSDFQSTRESWRRDGPAALARVQKKIGREEALLAAVPAAARQSVWAALIGHLPKAIPFAARCTLMLFYLNIIGFALSAIVRRFVLPRRRFA